MYASLADVKSYMGIAGNDANDDALIITLIERASGIIDGITDRHFAGVTETKYFDAVDGSVLWLFGEDLISIVSVTNGDGTEVPLSDCRLLPRNKTPKWGIEVMSPSSWQVGAGKEIAVNGKWGYSETPPPDIVHATVRLTAFLYRQKDTSADVDRPLVTGDGVTIMPTGLPSDVKSLVSKYRRIVS